MEKSNQHTSMIESSIFREIRPLAPQRMRSFSIGGWYPPLVEDGVYPTELVLISPAMTNDHSNSTKDIQDLPPLLFRPYDCRQLKFIWMQSTIHGGNIEDIKMIEMIPTKKMWVTSFCHF